MPVRIESSGFLQAFFRELLTDLHKMQTDNKDPFGYRPAPQSPRWKESLIGKRISAFRSLGGILRKSKQFGILYNSLCDEASRGVMTKVLASRVLGTRRVKLPSNNILGNPSL